jgi:iron complex outermembrane receptor protein
MKKIFLLLFWLVTLTATAQITGQITNELKQPLAGAGVQFYQNQKITKALLTDTGGRFAINYPKAGYLVITYLGYATDTIKSIRSDLGIISLKPLTNILTEVKIKNRQPIIHQQTDRTVISISQQVLKLADNVLEIVNLVPGLSVSDQDDAILMSGKTEVQIMLNDKVIKMNPRDLAKLLKAMPARSVNEVEIMTNPSAKYEVNGNTGIINIKTNNVVKGFMGNVDYSTSQSTYNWSDPSGIINYGAGLFAISSYLAWHSGGYLTKDLIQRGLNNAILSQQNSNLDKWSDPVVRITADYQLSKRSTVGVIIEREASTNKSSYTNNSFIYNNSAPDTAYQTIGSSPSVRHWNTYNLNYRYSDTLGSELTLDLDRATYARDERKEILNTGLQAVNYQTFTNIDINTLKADFTHNWKSKLKLETGLKFAGVQTHNNFNNDRFFYNEHVNALYAGLSKEYGKWGWQLGLRAEQSRVKGVANAAANGEIIKPDSSYFNLLPSLYLTYAPTEKHNFRLSVSRRIKRPNYDDLQPFTYQVDPLNYKTGNAGLYAQRNDNAELAYTYNGRVSLVSSYSKSANYFNPVILQTGNVLYQTTGNAGTMSGWNFDLSYPIKVVKWWNMINKANLAFDHFNGQLFQGYLDQGKWGYQLSTIQRFNLMGKYLLQVSGRYTSAKQSLIYYLESSANSSISIGRKLFNDQGSIKIGYSDIFKSQRNNTSVNFGNLRYTDLGSFESQRISLQFSWQFGNQKIRQAINRERGDTDEKGRSGS